MGGPSGPNTCEAEGRSDPAGSVPSHYSDAGAPFPLPPCSRDADEAERGYDERFAFPTQTGQRDVTKDRI